ncbi:MAG: hypothetical protein ACPLRZ_06130 [Thermovenabulum sp.]|uniref:hypothetical protein n=1 Tax=Thermovenabulum sp. TaxID=3100335 RepID=UPI003C7AD5EA
MDILKTIAVLSIVIESLTNTILFLLNVFMKSFKSWSEEEKKGVIGIFLSVFITVSINLNIFEVSKITFKYPIIGTILTGFLFARGANVINDILDIIYYTKEDKKALKVERKI